jgi:lipase ATG15
MFKNCADADCFLLVNSKCHTGRICVYDPVGEDKWGIDIRKHRLADTIEGVLKVKDVPSCKTQDDCEDCTQWKFTTEETS